MDCGPPGSYVHAIFQAEILEWVAIFFSSGFSRPRDQTHVSWFGRQILYPCGGGLVAKSSPTLATPWTVAHQALLSMGFSRQVYWSGLPFPSPGDLSNLGIEPRSPAMEADALTSEPPRMKQKNKKVTRSMIQSKSNKNAKFGERIT